MPNSDSGTAISRMSSVIAIANTPSLNASVRPVSQRSLTKEHFHGTAADPAQPPTRQQERLHSRSRAAETLYHN